jgi:hypothetical protein
VNKQKCYCWHLNKKEVDDAIKEYKAAGYTVAEHITQGYCPSCGYNFNLSVLNVDSTEDWRRAPLTCPKCGSEGTAGQYWFQHRKMSFKTKGCLLLVIAIGAIVTFIVRSCS